jgi:hypothetical protein
VFVQVLKGNLIRASKAVTYLNGASFSWSTKEVFADEKHSSLFTPTVRSEELSFVIGPVANVIKCFLSVIYEFL